MKVTNPNKVRRASWAGDEKWSGLRRVSVLSEYEDGRCVVGFPDPQDEEQVVFVLAQPSDLTFLEGTSDLATELGL